MLLVIQHKAWSRFWYNPVYEEPMFDRGYTGHEHLYTFGLINMNGLRVLCGEDTPKDYQG